MTALKHVFDGTRENFQQLVVENSSKGAVLVNYWAPNAGPCLRLWKVLEGLSREYQGRFLLVNVNTDSQGSLVRANSITSVPTLKIYHRGNIVESIYGAQSEATLRETIDKYVPPAQDTALARAIRYYQSGQADTALEILAQGCAGEPDNLKLHTTALKLLLRENRYADIESYVDELPDSVRAQAEIGVLLVHARMLHLAQQAPPAAQLDSLLEDNPDDPDTGLSRAALAMVEDDYETALLRLLHVLRRNPHYRDELPRKAMLAIFSLLGDEHTLTRKFQHAMREVLH